MSVTLSPSENRTYGVALVFRAWEIDRSTFYDWRGRRDSDVKPRRRGPRPPISKIEQQHVCNTAWRNQVDFMER